MTNIQIRISRTYNPRAGFSVRTVKRWSDPTMIAAGYDCVLRGNVGQFSMAEPYMVKADGMWVGQWGAISNYSNLTHDDILKISAMQIPDEYSMSQKMNYLYHELDDSGNTVAELWGHEPWETTTDARYGHMVHAGQKIAVSDRVSDFFVAMPNETAKRWTPMREIQAFRRSDFGKTHEEYPWLIQKCTVSLPPNNRYGDYPRGTVYMTTILDPRDFVAPNRAVKAYMPEEWLE